MLKYGRDNKLKNMNKKLLITGIILITIALIFLGLVFLEREESEPINEKYLNNNQEINNNTEKPQDEEDENNNNDNNNNNNDIGENEEINDFSNEVNGDKKMVQFVDCLARAGIVIYGSKTCPACVSLVNNFGGHEIIEPIYVECSLERDRCIEEMKDSYVPEIQIRGNLYQGPRSLEAIGEAVGCKY